jgi:tripartite-type tricarboxylate transporter receptor subunit TctC
MVRSAVGKFAFVVAIAALALPPAAQPQGFPSKPIRIIVPYTPGSPNDVIARLLAQPLQGKLGQAVVIDNKPGGGTAIGSKTAAVAPPDGYTLLFASSALVIEPILTKQVEYDPQKDFTPIAFVARVKALAITSPQRNPGLPDVPTMKELGLDELTLEFWAGMWAPAGVPVDVVEKLNAAVNAALQSPEMIASMKKLGFELELARRRISRLLSLRKFRAGPRW